MQIDYFKRSRFNQAWTSILIVNQIHNSFVWQGTTVYFPVIAFLSIQWLPFWWCSTNPCFFNNLIRSSGLILHLGILLSIIKWNLFFFYILLHSFQIALDSFFDMFLQFFHISSTCKTSWQFYYFCVKTSIRLLRYFYGKFCCSHTHLVKDKRLFSSYFLIIFNISLQDIVTLIDG